MRDAIRRLASTDDPKDLTSIVDKFPTLNINDKSILSKRQRHNLTTSKISVKDSQENFN